MTNKSNFLNTYLIPLLLVVLSAILFFLSNPNCLISKGVGFLAFIYYFPVLHAVKKSEMKYCWIFGGLYGFLTYALYSGWLMNYHPVAFWGVCAGYFIILAFVFLILKFIDILFADKAWLVQGLFLCAYEYLKTIGYPGISYGVTAYTQWKNIYLIQICDVAGVFGLNLIIIFPSCWLYHFIYKTKNIKKSLILPVLWLSIISGANIYGYYRIHTKESETEYKVLAVQNNEDPWENGINEYAKNLHALINLTSDALEFNSDVDFVVWPETSVVPSIMQNYYDSKDNLRFKFVSTLLNFMDSNNQVFVIGNAHQKYTSGGDLEKYNSAFVFESKVNVYPPNPDIYSKIHLVPFSESFPFSKTFPLIYLKLMNSNNHIWNAGSKYEVFDYRGLKFSTPICFEDNFGNDCRKFVMNGARCFFNLSNDSWANSLSCQNQHLAMAVFRCVENHVPAVRSCSSGQTCIIDSNGIIQQEAAPFCQTYIAGKIKVKNNFKTSLYTRLGDIAGIVETAAFLVILLIQIFRVIIRKLLKR